MKMISGRFYQLLDQARAEIERRAPEYLCRFPTYLPEPASVVGKYSNHPICAGYSTSQLERALSAGLAYIGGRIATSDTGPRACPMSDFWCDSIIDAFCAERGDLALEPWSDGVQSIAQILSTTYAERRGKGSLRYFVGRSGARPLLLLNATGIPVGVWNKLLSDSSHDFRIIVPEGMSGNFLEGGLRRKLDVDQECADLVSVMDAELIDKADVVAWCTGARVAVELAKRCDDRISSLVLIGPWFREREGSMSLDPSPFEKGLNSILKLVAVEPHLAPTFARSISQQTQMTDWSRVGNDPVRRAQTLFALPAREHSAAMIAHLTSGDSLVVLAQNAEAERKSATEDLLPSLAARIMLVMGAHDNIINNQLIMSVMRRSKRPFVASTVSASGHYVHDLQYSYFRLLLSEFLGRDKVPGATARISVVCENALDHVGESMPAATGPLELGRGCGAGIPAGGQQ
jgi:pimeloyl-ACP methyl ester carboxylesterase